MSTTYNGVAGNVSPPSALMITNVSAGATPTVTVSGALPASIVTTFTVTITGVQGATGANGTWTGTKTGASTFTIPSGAAGPYTTGGSAQPVLLEGITIPADGDALTASSVGVGFESLQDQIVFATSAIGQWKIVQTFGIGYLNTVNSTVGTSPTLSGGNWGDWTGAIASLMPFCTASGNGPLNVEAGDQVMVKVSSNILFTGTSGANSFMTSVWYANWVPGGITVYTQAPALAGAGIRTTGTTVASTAFTIAGMVPGPNIAGMGTTGLFDFKIRVISLGSTSGAGDLNLISGLYAEAIVLRPNILVPQ